MPAPKGNKNAARGFEATRALEKALARKSGIDDQEFVPKFEILVQIWEDQIDKALDGSGASAAMIFDRLEGKAAQAVDVTANVETTKIELTAKEAKAIDKTLDGEY